MSFKFLNYDNNDSPAMIREKFQVYRQYLADNANRLPEEAYAFAISDWHYGPQDHRCPHDSWVESLEIQEKGISITTKDKREVDIHLTLLGAYHDGRIEITYRKIKSYHFGGQFDPTFESPWHGDWLIDEIRLSKNNFVIHEIDFRFGGSWRIECENIIYNWLPDKISA